MSEFAEDMKAYREYYWDKKERNREYSTTLLTENGIQFISRNDGLHLLIETAKGRVNFFPSTGLYNGAISGRGVKNLLKDLKGIQDE